ncbi:hypothetical protein M409DRAFT_29504 [Zasmidium cellare ATCC 36951]|uniref:Uncharacterized protein n=1 Tax=Zasmidium cellare ATCC 36951 TaxID=1080233 RepID=A0A6A6BZ31_ZASCE|nr:uncharacterized protein M409DRAFT_29504 [Zasmidium cellare ATCC 36951]KAF2160054.1 hypothetical protein M409DRAFT_29504 [Zasmidium cellare ATCC 36951]
MTNSNSTILQSLEWRRLRDRQAALEQDQKAMEQERNELEQQKAQVARASSAVKTREWAVSRQEAAQLSQEKEVEEVVVDEGKGTAVSASCRRCGTKARAEAEADLRASVYEEFRAKQDHLDAAHTALAADEAAFRTDVAAYNAWAAAMVAWCARERRVLREWRDALRVCAGEWRQTGLDLMQMMAAQRTEDGEDSLATPPPGEPIPSFTTGSSGDDLVE